MAKHKDFEFDGKWKTTPPKGDEKKWKKERESNVEKIQDLQEKLFAGRKHAVLVCLQGMDTAGKDSLIRKVFGPINPNGVRVCNFKRPTQEENEHGYLWRHEKMLPRKGQIHIFNRTHYENVLVTRVHPEYLLPLNINGVDKVKDVDTKFWKNRFKEIVAAEDRWDTQGTTVLKFFLNISKKEQANRLLERLARPEKHWKFEAGDVKERGYWEQYMNCYEEALEHTSTKQNPWYVVPSDSKDYARYVVSEIVLERLQKLDLEFPKADQDLESQMESYIQQIQKR